MDVSSRYHNRISVLHTTNIISTNRIHFLLPTSLLCLIYNEAEKLFIVSRPEKVVRTVKPGIGFAVLVTNTAVWWPIENKPVGPSDLAATDVAWVRPV